ncbi:PREDICTED: G-type lectin S-receptor-like serine/threonine-protein kinase At1g11410-like [Fragaria vesca subsp. vesca]
MYFTKGLLNALLQLLLPLLSLQSCNSLSMTITFNQFIKDGDFLISKNEAFVLGFFSPGTSSNRYVGIWYRFSQNKVLWVANRDHPVNDTSGILTISTEGNLILHYNTSQSLPLWSTNVSVIPMSSNSTMVQLQDSGNLVLVNQQVHNQSGVLWQSSDHPTHILLANMKIGFQQGKNIFITSWKSKNDPGTGNCSIKTEPSGSPQIILYKNRAKWRRSGHWDGLHWNGFPNVNRLSKNISFDIVLVNNKDEITTKFVVLEPSVISIIEIDGSGSLQLLAWKGQQQGWVTLWSPTDVCDRYEPNSPEEWRLREGSGGCKRLQGAPSMCRNGERFVKIQNVKVPDSSTINLDINLTMEACEQKCLNNCSCLAYASADVRNGGSGCMTWYGDLMDTTQFAQGQGQDLYIRADAIVSGSLMKQYGSIAHKDLEYFNLKSILAATDNFSIANKLGEGGFGPVYKGLLANGEEIAVKRLSKNSGQGLEQFKTEVKLIAKLQHRNLVRLLGCCFNSEEKMLIYEYLPNKSLDFFIFDRSRSLSIDWKKRFDIINGIARGVLYLHQDSRLKIVHRDIKASNVLLDSTMNPKISDFGLAKMIGEDQLQANTNRVIGTYGYMSPEYAMEGRCSTKSDVFSFGILLLEIISGKRNTDYNLNSPSLNLIGEIWDMWREGQALGIVDPSLSLYPAHEVSRCIHIGLLFVQESTTDRPTMSEVVYMLGKEAPLTSPKKPAFILQSSNPNSEEASIRGPSINNVTKTMLEAR